MQRSSGYFKSKARPVKIIEPKDAVVKAAEILRQNGFLLIRKSECSFYFKKKGANHLVRISDHPRSKGLSLIHYDLVFNYPTIWQDVEYQVKSIIRKFTGFTVKGK